MFYTQCHKITIATVHAHHVHGKSDLSDHSVKSTYQLNLTLEYPKQRYSYSSFIEKVCFICQISPFYEVFLSFDSHPTSLCLKLVYTDYADVGSQR